MQTHRLVVSCILGLAAGMAAVGFHVTVHGLFVGTVQTFSLQSAGSFLWKSFLVLMGANGIAAVLLARYGCDAAGSGIPQLKLAFWKDFGYVPLRTTVVKFVAGALSIGGGLSLGREGPTVQIAGGLASQLSGRLGMAKQARRGACAAGAAAGLAAAFNTPLAAITFVLEEIIGDLNSRHLGGVVLAAVMGALTVHACLGDQPSFQLLPIQEMTWGTYAAIPVIATAGGVVGILFQRLTMSFRRGFKRLRRIPLWLQPLAGALLTWALGVTVFLWCGRLGVFGLGYEDLTEALKGDMVFKTAAVLLVAKFFCITLAYGSGGCGGIFAPLLFLGGMTGYSGALLLSNLIPLQPGDLTVLAVVGMGACFTAVVRAPMTAILMMFEMTHQFLLLPPLMLATLVGQLFSMTGLKHSFYDEVLLQDGHDLHRVLPPRDLQQWRQRPIASLATFHPVTIEEDHWDNLREVLEAHGYSRFPVVRNKSVVGILPRREAELALTEGRRPHLLPVTTVAPEQTLGEVQLALIDSGCDLVVVAESTTRRPLGVVTLHDLLRQQMEISERQ